MLKIVAERLLKSVCTIAAVNEVDFNYSEFFETQTIKGKKRRAPLECLSFYCMVWSLFFGSCLFFPL